MSLLLGMFWTETEIALITPNGKRGYSQWFSIIFSDIFSGFFFKFRLMTTCLQVHLI